MAYVAPRTWTVGQTVTAAMMNQDVRDNVGAVYSLAGTAANAAFALATTANSTGGSALALAGTANTTAGTAFVLASKLYAGATSSGGTAAFAPSGWTVSRLSQGKYEVTHNLNTANYAPIAAADGRYAVIKNKGTATFEIWALDGLDAVQDASHYYIVMKA